jgi:hypothetical protein
MMNIKFYYSNHLVTCIEIHEIERYANLRRTDRLARVRAGAQRE